MAGIGILSWPDAFKNRRKTIAKLDYIIYLIFTFCKSSVNQYDRITVLLTLEDKALVQGLVDMLSSDDKEKKEFAKYLFDAMIQGYRKGFSADEKDNEIVPLPLQGESPVNFPHSHDTTSPSRNDSRPELRDALHSTGRAGDSRMPCLFAGRAAHDFA